MQSGPDVKKPVSRPGQYDVLISVGTKTGTPKIALPLDGGDGQRRYRIGTIDIGREEK